MNTQVRLQNSLFRLAGRVISELIGSMRKTERMIRKLFAIFTQLFLKCLLFISWRTRYFENYTVCTSYCLCELQNLSKYVITCQSNLPFCVDKEKENPAKPYRGLPQASHGKSEMAELEVYLIVVLIISFDYLSNTRKHDFCFISRSFKYLLT